MLKLLSLPLRTFTATPIAVFLPSVLLRLTSRNRLSIRWYTVYQFFCLVNSPLRRLRWARVVLMPEITVSFIVFSCLPVMRERFLVRDRLSDVFFHVQPVIFRVHCLLHAFSTVDVPLSNRRMQAASLDCKCLEGISKLLHLEMLCKQERHFGTPWSSFVVRPLSFRPVGIGDPDIGRQVVVEVLVSVPNRLLLLRRLYVRKVCLMCSLLVIAVVVSVRVVL